MSDNLLPETIDLVIQPRLRDLGDGFTVRRILPYARRRHVGPFVFLDHMGPVRFEAGRGLDVRPHPHIGLATVTYLFEGEIMHRDSLGIVQPIRPGDVNWMVAGRGIAHSERTPDHLRPQGGPLHGVQAWIALPKAWEETEPAFQHVGGGVLPAIEKDGARLRLIAGAAFGMTSPVRSFAPTFYLDAALDPGGVLPLPEEYGERAIYIVDGSIAVDGELYESGSLVVFKPDVRPDVAAHSAARLMLLGGAPLDVERHIWWNFVSSSPERIEQAKRDWREGRFAAVPGDDEFIPLPP
ncbi:MAG TPA: pirin family protein [Ferrovibrio sp.]|uniref:pirin family protein n=1 Tax=Ferrovibrio sp. TaxID=1917215 RepID=UPI002ED408FC